MSYDLTSPQRPTHVRWIVFGLGVATSWLLYLHRYVFGFLKPILAEEWGLSNEALGDIDSAFAAAYIVFQFPLAVLADAFGVHLILPLLLIVWLAGLGLMARSTSADGMWWGQAVLATGQSAVYACLNRVGRMWYPPRLLTTMQGAVGILAGRLGGWSASLIFATLLLGMLGLTWQAAIGCLLAAGIVHLVLFAALFRNSPREHPWVNEAERALIEGEGSTSANRKRMSVREMLSRMSPRSIRNLSIVTVQSLLSTVADNIFSNWIPKFLSDVNPGIKFTELGLYASLPLLGGALAGLVGGVLNDFLIARTGNRRWTRVAVAVTGKGLSAILLLVALLAYRDPYLFCVILFFVKFFGDWSLSTLWGVVADIGGRVTASVFAVNNSIAALGMIIAPKLFGMLADQYGWPTVFATAAATMALCALSWFWIDCTIPVLDESKLPSGSDATS
jgi:ACS family glucarate transporter-like MFS transporter